MNIVNDKTCSWLNDLNIIKTRSEPTWLPPQPFLNIGVKTRLMFERLRSRSDV